MGCIWIANVVSEMIIFVITLYETYYTVLLYVYVMNVATVTEK